MEDEEIVALFLDRDERAVELSAKKYGARLRKLAFGITDDRLTAEECENDAYLQAWNRIPPNEPRTYLYAFLARIVRHIAIDRCRERSSLKRAGHIELLDEEIEHELPVMTDPGDMLAAKALGEAISRYLRTLSREKRAMFVRRYFYLDSIDEISRRFAITEGKVKSALFRARGGLREFLIKEGYTL